MTAAVLLELDMMKIEISRRTTAWDRAAMVIASEHLPAYALRDRGSHAVRIFGGQRADLLAIAARTLRDLAADLDLASGTVLPGAAASLAHRDRHLVRRPFCWRR